MDFINLKRQYDKIEDEMNERIQNVLYHQKFIMGPEIEELEKKLAGYTGRKYVYTCASGTDALVIPLMAYELKSSDAVFVPSFTFFASAESIVLAGGTPVFVDSGEDFNIDIEDLEKKIKEIIESGRLTPRGIMAVDLFGQACDYEEIQKIADKYDLFVIEDGAQSMGGEYSGKKNNSFGDISATSFFPAKPLGGYGDSGAIFTDHEDLAERIASIRVHGQGTSKYDNVRIGLNGRMDTLQAAILMPKLSILDEEIQARQKIANAYMEKLKGIFVLPVVKKNKVSAWAQFSLLAKNKQQREMIITEMKKNDIPIMVYYPIPLHMQTAFKRLGYRKGELKRCEEYAERIFSIPMSPYITEEEIEMVCNRLIMICS